MTSSLEKRREPATTGRLSETQDAVTTLHPTQMIRPSAQSLSASDIELADQLTEADARSITSDLRNQLDCLQWTVHKIVRLVEKARDGRAHLALGYRSWTEYVSEELGVTKAEGPRTKLARDDRKKLVEMTSPSAPHGDAITRAEAARILAVHVATVDRLIRHGVLTPGRRYATAQLSREQVESLALTTRPVKRLIAGDYWVSRKGAATLLGVSERRVQ